MKARDGKVISFSALDGYLAVSSQVGENTLRIQIFDATGTLRNQLRCVKSSHLLGLSWVHDGRVLLCVLSDGRVLEYCNFARKYITSHSLALKERLLNISTCTALKTGFILTTDASMIIFMEYKYRHLVVRKIDLSEHVLGITQLEVTQCYGGGCYVQSNNSLCLFSSNKMQPREIRLISSFAVAPSGSLVATLTMLLELYVFSSDLHMCTFRCVIDPGAGTATPLLQWHTSKFLFLFLCEEIILLKMSTDYATKCSRSIKHPWHEVLEQLHWWRNGARVCLSWAQHSHTKWVSSCELLQYIFDVNHIDLSVIKALRPSISFFKKFRQDIPDSLLIHGFTSGISTQASGQHSITRRRQLSGFLRGSGKMYSGLKICPDLFKGRYIMDWFINFADSFATQQSPIVAAQILDKTPPLILDESALGSLCKRVLNVRSVNTHQILQLALVRRDSVVLCSILSTLQDENDVYRVMKFLGGLDATEVQGWMPALNKYYKKYVLNTETLGVKFDVVETKLLVESAVRDWRAASLLEDSNTQRNILNLLSARMKE